MKALNLITLTLLIIGGLNWGLVGAFEFDLVAAIFGEGSALSRLVYILVALSPLWQIRPRTSACRTGKAHAEAGHRTTPARL